jgi:hypothetical protein
MNKPVTIPLPQPSVSAASDDRVYLHLVGKETGPSESAPEPRIHDTAEDVTDEIEDLWDNVPV